MPPSLLTLLSIPLATAVSLQCGICPGGNASGSVGSFPTALLGVSTNPTGNTPLTFASLSVQGETGQGDEREFLVSEAMSPAPRPITTR